MRARAKLFWQLFWHGWWRPISTGVFVIGLYDTLVGQLYPEWPTVGAFLPQVQWWGWLILLLVVILFAVLEGAYRVTQKGNKVGEEFNFEFNDFSLTTKDGRILLGVTCLPTDKATVETLQLDYNDKRFRPVDWQPIEIKHSHTKNYTFDLNGLRDVANQTSQEAVFIAKVNGKKFRSLPFNIYKLL